MLALVVDDSRMARYVLSKMLKEQGIDVDAVESGEEALGYLCGKAPDMIFMDHTMPGMDGFQALRAIKNDPRTSPIPIMMYTSKEGEVYMNQARQLGAVDVLPKQLKPDQLKAVLEKQRLLPHLADKQKAANDDGEGLAARIITASDLGEDIQQVAKAAEKSIENKNFTNQFRRLLEEHKTALAEQGQERMAGLIEQFDERLSTVSERLDHLLNIASQPRGPWQRFSGSTRALIITVLVLAFLWMITSNLQKSQELNSLTREVVQLKDAIKTEDAKAEITQSELEQELQDIIYDQQLQNNEWLANFEWALNRDNQFPWNAKPYNDQLAEKLGVIGNRLQAAGFEGVISLTSHLGDFCFTSNSAGAPILPEEDQLVATCSIRSLPQGEAETLGMEQTMGFNHFLAAFELQFGDAIRIEMDTRGNQEPVKEYPEQEPDLLASEWNKVAAANQRVTIELKPVSR
ncbi:MAG: response regulator [Ketobacteraceae bacterium]|nr:response regulator [Ketobacteraceae bacterium]